MPFAEEAFSTLGETIIKEGRKISADDVSDVDILAIRSTTDVSQDLLQDSSVKFVGTATIGTDHMDIAYMENAGIKWCFAPGCNANSVSEYVTSALLSLAYHHDLRLDGQTIGIIGVGNVGKLVAEKAKAMGMNVLLNDPPRQEAENNTSDFVALDDLLAEADIITTHVPLVKEGKYPTYHLADSTFFHKMKPGTIFLNCARGAIVYTKAMLSAMDEGIVSHAVVDTWEGEPKINKDLLHHVDIGTPHIAGHSFEGKVMGTVMVYREACRFLGVEPVWTPDNLMPEPLVPNIEIDATDMTDEDALWNAVQLVYNVELDDKAFRAVPGKFDKLRREYPMRREFRFTNVSTINASRQLQGKIAALGFKMGM